MPTSFFGSEHRYSKVQRKCFTYICCTKEQHFCYQSFSRQYLPEHEFFFTPRAELSDQNRESRLCLVKKGSSGCVRAIVSPKTKPKKEEGMSKNSDQPSVAQNKGGKRCVIARRYRKKASYSCTPELKINPTKETRTSKLRATRLTPKLAQRPPSDLRAFAPSNEPTHLP